MNPRELMARLNVPAVRYDIGRGGLPELTNIDIAGALGMIHDEFARDVFTALWWHDGAARGSASLEARVFDLILCEFGHRSRALAIAKLEQHMAETAINEKIHRTGFDERIVQACYTAVTEAKARSWPYDTNVMRRIPRAVIQEIHTPRPCGKCAGRGECVINGLIVRCETCRGSRVLPERRKNRAVQIRVNYRTYLDSWRKVYEWTYNLITRADAHAASIFAAAASRQIVETGAYGLVSS